jgi:hypothetical protein
VQPGCGSSAERQGSGGAGERLASHPISADSGRSKAPDVAKVAVDVEEFIPAAPAALLVPKVPGRIVWLHPIADGSRGDAPDLDAVADTDAAPDKDRHGGRQASAHGTGEDAAGDARRCGYEWLRIRADAMTLGTVRMCAEALNDHYLDNYRMGLGMPSYPELKAARAKEEQKETARRQQEALATEEARQAEAAEAEDWAKHKSANESTSAEGAAVVA